MCGVGVRRPIYIDTSTQSPTTHTTHLQDPDDWADLCVALACVVCAAMAAGLTIGLMVRGVCPKPSIGGVTNESTQSNPTFPKTHTRTRQSIDPLELEIKQRVGTPEECRQASVVLPLIQRHHLLLVTLLLYNSAANETLPLFLDRLVPSYVAVLLSVTMVLLFGGSMEPAGRH